MIPNSSRRSLLLTLKDKQTYVPDPEDADDDYVEQSTKRRKLNCTSKPAQIQYTQIQRRRGKLNQLPEMPLDILFEIFECLTPLDILRLARTTKSLRYILMRRSAISVWKAARANVPELLDCPPDMTEPQYANLVFCTNCHYCLVPGAATVVWVYRIRCCMKCLDLHFMDGAGSLSLPYIASMYSEFIPTYRGRVKGRYRVIVSRDYVEELHAKITEVKDDEDKLQVVLNEAKQFVQERSQGRYLFDSWYRDRKARRSDTLDAARQRRRDTIVNRLKELDPSWSNEFQLLDSIDRTKFFSHPFVKQPKDLTDRIWVNIKGTLIGLLEKYKEQREKTVELKHRRQLFATFIKEYIKGRPHDEILPRPVDFYFAEGARAIRVFIETTPFDRQVTSENLEQFKELLPQLAEEWKTSCTVQLLDLLRTDHDKDTPVDESILDLATTWFFCGRCSEPISFPRVLVHHCLWHGFTPYPTKCDSEANAQIAFGDTLWSLNNLRPFSIKRKESFEVAKSIIEACGYDVSTTTSAFMDEVDPIFECKTCGGDPRIVMPWRTAVCHPLFRGMFHRVSTVLIDTREIAIVRTKLAQRNQSRVCNYCRHESSDVWEMQLHIRRAHGINGDMSPEHCVPHMDNSWKCATVSLWKDWSYQLY